MVILIYLIFIAINEVTNAIVSVTFCDKIQFIIEARNELFKAKKITSEWGDKVIN